MTLVGLAMLIVFGFLAVRHYLNGRYIWMVVAGFGSLVGAGSLWVDYMRANSPVQSGASAVPAPASDAPVIGDYKPAAEANGTQSEPSE